MPDDSDILDKEVLIPSLEPLYGIGSIGGGFGSKKINAVLDVDGTEYPGEAEVTIDLRNQNILILRGKIKGIEKEKIKIKDGLFVSKESHSLYIKEVLVNDIKNNPVRYILNDRDELEFFLLKYCANKLVKDKKIKKSDKLITKAKFHLFNFCDFKGNKDYKKIYKLKGKRALEHVGLISKKWVVHLASTEFTKDSIELFKIGMEQGLTHVGEISNKEAGVFSINELEKILNSLDMFFHFSKGRFCPTCIIQAYDAEGNIVCEKLSIPELTGETDRDNWFNQPTKGEKNKPKSELLEKLFPQFIKKSGDENWEGDMSEAIRWYHLSNSYRDERTSIILTQTALELLAYRHVAVDKKLIPEGSFDGSNLKAFDKMHLLFSSLGFETKISPYAKKLVARSKKNDKQWEMSPKALAEVRNSLVHSKTTRKGYEGIFGEISGLGLWYLELTILAICGYNGKYYNRLSKKNENIPLTDEIKELSEVKKELSELKAKKSNPKKS